MWTQLHVQLHCERPAVFQSIKLGLNCILGLWKGCWFMSRALFRNEKISQNNLKYYVRDNLLDWKLLERAQLYLKQNERLTCLWPLAFLFCENGELPKTTKMYSSLLRDIPGNDFWFRKTALSNLMRFLLIDSKIHSISRENGPVYQDWKFWNCGPFIASMVA